jgi:hypothetical protein
MTDAARAGAASGIVKAADDRAAPPQPTRDGGNAQGARRFTERAVRDRAAGFRGFLKTE